MADVIKQAGIKQSDGTYQMKDIGVDYQNVDGLATAATAFKAKSADKATGDKNNKDITEYLAGLAKNGKNIRTTNGAGTTADVNFGMTGATPTTNGAAGFVPAPTTADNTKFLKGDGTWDDPQDTTYSGSSNIQIGSNNTIDLSNTTVSSGTYGPSADVTGSNGVTILVPKFTVDAKGRLTSAGTQTYTSVDTTYSAGSGLGLTGTQFSLASHAASSTGYGSGTASNYGHVKLSDTYNSAVSGGNAAGGLAASQNALYNAYNELNSKINKNHYVDITTDFNNGTFSSNLEKYAPGNYIKKTYSNVTYVAVLAHYNYFYNPGRSDYANINVPHWVAIVLGFTDGQMNSSNTTAGGFSGSAMYTWLNGACKTAITGAFGSSHLIANQRLLSNGTYNASSVTHGFSWGWTTNAEYACLMSEAQVYGGPIWSDLGFGSGEANRQLRVFQNASFMEVLGRGYGQSNDNFNSKSAWLRDIGAASPGTDFCLADYRGTADYRGASTSRGRFPIINLK